jgi:prophage regulatory protein
MHPNSITPGAGPRLLPIKQVLQRTGLGRTSTYELVSRGLHPAPIKLGRASRWVDRQIDAFIEQLVERGGL